MAQLILGFELYINLIGCHRICLAIVQYSWYDLVFAVSATQIATTYTHVAVDNAPRLVQPWHNLVTRLHVHVLCTRL